MKNKKLIILFLFTIVISLYLFISKSHLGFVTNDEAFYLSTPYRFLNGDRMLIDEWNLSQLSSLILLPILKIYTIFFPTTESIYFNFRIIYSIIHIVSACLMVCILIKKIDIGYWGIIVFILFVPFGILAINYNSIAYILLSLISVIVLTGKYQKKGWRITLGVLYSVSVLMNPFYIAIFVAFLIYIMINILKNKQSICEYVKYFIFYLYGICLVFIPFLLYLFSNASIENIVNSIPHILSDPAHQTKGIFDFFSELLYFFILYWKLAFPILVCAIFSIFSRGKLKKISYIFFLVLSMILCLYFGLVKFNEMGMNTVMIPISLVGIVSFSMCNNKNYDYLYAYCLGVVCSICNFFASNQGIYAISNGIAITCIVSVFMTQEYIKELNFKNNKNILLFYFVITVQLVSQINVFINHIFWENSKFDCIVEIKEGPYANIMTTYNKSLEYNEILNDLKSLTLENENVLFLQNIPWAYQYTRANVSSFSTWGLEIDSLYDKTLESYYELNPDMIPKFIYIHKNSVDIYSNEILSYAYQKGYKVKYLNSGSIILKFGDENYD